MLTCGLAFGTPCPTLPFGDPVPIHLHEGYSVQVAIPAGRLVDYPAILYASSKQTGKITANRKGDAYSFTGLAPGVSLTVYYINPCGEQVVVGTSPTSFRTGDVIAISSDLHAYLIELVYQETMSDERIIDHVSQYHDPVVAASFLQRFFLKGKPVGDGNEIVSVLESKSNRAKNNELNCDCEQLTVLPENILNPGDIQNSEPSGNFIIDDTDDFRSGDPGWPQYAELD